MKVRGHCRCLIKEETLRKENGWMCDSHIDYLVLYQLPALPFLCTVLVNLKRVLFQFVWRTQFVLCVARSVTVTPSKAAFKWVPNVEIRCHTFRLSFLGRLCAQHDENSEFWKEDAKKAFPILKSVYLNDRETRQWPENQCWSSHECQHALKVFLTSGRHRVGRYIEC